MCLKLCDRKVHSLGGYIYILRCHSLCMIGMVCEFDDLPTDINNLSGDLHLLGGTFVEIFKATRQLVLDRSHFPSSTVMVVMMMMMH